MSSCAVGRVAAIAAALGFLVDGVTGSAGLGWVAAAAAAVVAVAWSLARRRSGSAACGIGAAGACPTPRRRTAVGPVAHGKDRPADTERQRA